MQGPSEHRYIRERKRGYLDALRDAGVEPREDWILEMPSLSYESVGAAISMLLQDKPPVDALITTSDLYGMAAIKAARRCGLQLPHDLYIATFDNSFISVLSDPSMTSVSQPLYQMGYTACEMLVHRLKDPSYAANSMTLDAEMIIRESTSE